MEKNKIFDCIDYAPAGINLRKLGTSSESSSSLGVKEFLDLVGRDKVKQTIDSYVNDKDTSDAVDAALLEPLTQCYSKSAAERNAAE